jgi:hypothetical protein
VEISKKLGLFSGFFCQQAFMMLSTITTGDFGLKKVWIVSLKMVLKASNIKSLKRFSIVYESGLKLV